MWDVVAMGRDRRLNVRIGTKRITWSISIFVG
jgi:hypothetical protein